MEEDSKLLVESRESWVEAQELVVRVIPSSHHMHCSHRTVTLNPLLDS